MGESFYLPLLDPLDAVLFLHRGLGPHFELYPAFSAAALQADRRVDCDVAVWFGWGGWVGGWVRMSCWTWARVGGCFEDAAVLILIEAIGHSG